MPKTKVEILKVFKNVKELRFYFELATGPDLIKNYQFMVWETDKLVIRFKIIKTISDCHGFTPDILDIYGQHQFSVKELNALVSNVGVIFNFVK